MDSPFGLGMAGYYLPLPVMSLNYEFQSAASGTNV